MRDAGTPAQLRDALVKSGTWDEAFCTEPCLRRYLRARNMNVSAAHDMIKATLEWRREQRVGELAAEEFAESKFMRDGWVYVDGHDPDGRPVVVFRKRRDKLPLSDSEEYLRYMMFVVETAVRAMENGQEQWVWVLDLAAYSPSNAPHLSVTLGVLNMLANHYPERLHKAYVVNAPSIFSLAWKIITPFIDPVTRSKAEFVNTTKAAAPPKAHEASSWGSWAGSRLFHKAPPSQADVSVVVEEAHGPAKAAAAAAGGTFGPLMPIFERPYDYGRHGRLLAGLW